MYVIPLLSVLGVFLYSTYSSFCLMMKTLNKKKRTNNWSCDFQLNSVTLVCKKSIFIYWSFASSFQFLFSKIFFRLNFHLANTWVKCRFSDCLLFPDTYYSHIQKRFWLTLFCKLLVRINIANFSCYLWKHSSDFASLKFHLHITSANSCY